MLGIRSQKSLAADPNVHYKGYDTGRNRQCWISCGTVSIGETRSRFHLRCNARPKTITSQLDHLTQEVALERPKVDFGASQLFFALCGFLLVTRFLYWTRGYVERMQPSPRPKADFGIGQPNRVSTKRIL
jgi:hypothetical protein